MDLDTMMHLWKNLVADVLLPLVKVKFVSAFRDKLAELSNKNCRRLSLKLMVILLVLIMLQLTSCFPFSECKNQIIKEIPSPNGQFKVILFERGCGATTGFNTQVSVLPAGADLP